MALNPAVSARVDAPFLALGEPLDAFVCEEEECGYISISRPVIAQHCNTKHEWQSKKDDRNHWMPVKAQTFFRTGGFQRYFTVLPAAAAAGPAILRAPAAVHDAEVAAILSEYEEGRVKRENEFKTADDSVARTDRTGWFNRNGWPEHLARRNLRHLSCASRAPDHSEQVLQQAARVVELAIEQSVAGLSTLAQETRRWLKSASREEIEQRPMARLQNPESQRRYAGYMKRFVCYCLRVVAVSDGDAGSRSSRQGGSIDSDADESDDEQQSGENNQDPMRDARELFPWHGNQRHLAQDLLRLVRSGYDEKAQIAKVIELLGSFIFQEAGDHPFSSALVHFLAVLGIDEETTRLRVAEDYPYMLAGVVYCTRVLAIEYLLPSARRESHGKPERKMFLQQRRRFLRDGSYSPMSTMISLLAYSKKIAMNTANSASTQWSRDMSILHLHGRPIVIKRFKAMVGGVLKQAEDMLWEQLMYISDGAERFSIPLERVQDDVTFTSRGYSFLSRPGNELGAGFEWMVRRLVRSQTGQKMRAGGRWHHRHVRRYLRKVDRFLELLLFLVHTTGGQPARGTEITTARYQNGFLQDRNIFVMDGQVVFVSRYHKTQSLWDKPRVIPRFLPWRVSQLFSIFLAYVHPLSEHLVSHVTGRSWSDYVWASRSGPWETERLTRVVARETAAWLGCRLTTLEYRHAAITLGREFVGAQFGHGFREQVGEEVIEEPEMELENGLDLQAGRTEKIGVQTYGVPVDIVQRLSIRSVQFFRQLSERWHSFLNLSSSREQQEGKCAKGHQKLHRFLPAEDNSSGEKRPYDVPEGETRVSKHQRTEAYNAMLAKPAHPQRYCEGLAASDAKLELAMQKALGQAQTSFRSAEQKLAMQAILQRETPLVVVLPTGGGKSLLFMVPACLPDPGVTIVVVPFRALLNDLSDRLEKAGIDYIEWRGGQVNPAAIVLVSADFAGRWNFLTYASLLDQKGLLRRVVIDECHLTYTASHYRARLAQLKNLRFLSCPIVLLTATQPPMLEHELAEAMLVRGAQYIRASTVRPNIRYLVHTVPASKMLMTAVQICQRQMSCLNGCKGVVYCKSRDQCEEMAQHLGCGFYHAGIGAEDRTNRVDRWVSDGGFIVATSALGTGVDYPGIVYVPHVGVPYGMIDFAQESGRAGRGGEAVDLVILADEEAGRAEDASQSLDELVMRAFVYSESCRRAIMSSPIVRFSELNHVIDKHATDYCPGQGTRLAS
ncbi:hypothetical protein E8E12_000446 [Didymella heteroderae]|uniref:DNA 3'-5' helicase n=1 Tax=Didymella heteroderae TaxID=1769908 RepID=A0A9P5BV10_9PLEO|nr:hypothetical protein E8E12_000446 [Didymella heteroderae]